jgi:hypothetical protein
VSFSYTADFSDSAAGRRNRVRFFLGDTDETVQQKNRRLENEEIDAIVARNGNNVAGATLECGEALLARWGHREVGTVKGEQSSRFDQLERILDRMRRNGPAVMQATGITVADKKTTAEDTDIVQPSFFRDLMNNPGSDEPSPGRDLPEEE